MITWVMVGLLLAAETCGRNVLSGNGNGKEESKQKDGLKGITAEEEDIYRGYRCRKATLARKEEERERERERDEWKKSRGERAERVPGANRSMICSANSSLSNPLESCNRAPLILLPAFLPLNRSRWPLYLHPPSTNFPQIIPPSPISARPSLVTHCSEISPTLPLSCQPYLNQTPFAVSEPSSGEFTLFESRSKERKKRKEGTFFLLLYAFFLFSAATCSLAWVATLGSLPSPSSDQSSNEKVCIPLA